MMDLPPAKKVKYLLPTDEEHMDEDELQRLINGAEEVEGMTSSSLKRAVLSLEKKISKNRQMRVKYPDQPDKFLDSEVELDQEIKDMATLATSPDLYPEFVKLGAVPSLLSLLSHENTDIAIDVIELLNDLCDADVVSETEDADVLVSSLLENGALEMLEQNLSRLDESQKEDSDAVYKTLAILESLAEIDPSHCDTIATKTKFPHFLLNRMKSKAFDANKLELLSIILQSSANAHKTICSKDLDGLESILQRIAAYRKTEPKSDEEKEYVENLYNCLCHLLMHEEHQNQFRVSEGLELLIIVIKKCAIKLLAYALGRNPTNCNKFVEVLGMKTLFAALMGKGAKKKGSEVDDEEEHLVSSLSSLFQYLEGTERKRLLIKFSEKECEKVDRVVEIHSKYAEQILLSDQGIPDLDEEDSVDQYLRRLDAGLFTLQLADFVIASLALSSDEKVRSHLLQLLNQNDIAIDEVQDVLREYEENVGNDHGAEEQKLMKERIVALVLGLDKFKAE